MSIQGSCPPLRASVFHLEERTDMTRSKADPDQLQVDPVTGYGSSAVFYVRLSLSLPSVGSMSMGGRHRGNSSEQVS